MKKALLIAVSVPFALSVTGAAATTVGTFESSYTADYVWYKSDVRNAGTASVESLTGKGGNLENNAPLPTGAAKLTTGPANNADKAEVGINGNFGTVGQFLQTGFLSYDFYKSANDVNKSAAASIKLTVLDGNVTTAGTTDGYATFVYEPTWNIVSTQSHNPADSLWTNVDITGNSGIFWHTGIYGAGNLAGNGSNGFTLANWADQFGGDLLDAAIIGISVGVGTYNLGQTAYFDDVKYRGGGQVLAYDFEVSVVPLPAALPLYGTGLALMGLVGWRRKRKLAAIAA